MVPARLRDAERTAALSQQSDDESFATRIPSENEDLGSRAALLAVDDPLVWYPAEVNTSIRPGWFHHPRHDVAVRSADELLDVWCRSVGGNATLLLNVPPDRTGRLGAADVAVLRELGASLRALDAADVAAAGSWTFSSAPADPASMTSFAPDAQPWRPDPAQRSPWVAIRWDAPRQLVAILLREDLRHGQQIERVWVTAISTDGDEHALEVGAVGYQRLVRVDLPAVVALTVTVTARRGDLALAGLRALGPSRAQL